MFCFACKLYLRTELNPGQYLLIECVWGSPKRVNPSQEENYSIWFLRPVLSFLSVWAQPMWNQCFWDEVVWKEWGFWNWNVSVCLTRSSLFSRSPLMHVWCAWGYSEEMLCAYVQAGISPFDLAGQRIPSCISPGVKGVWYFDIRPSALFLSPC